jgi:hypothetical protein
MKKSSEKVKNLRLRWFIGPCVLGLFSINWWSLFFQILAGGVRIDIDWNLLKWSNQCLVKTNGRNGFFVTFGITVIFLRIFLVPISSW